MRNRGQGASEQELEPLVSLFRLLSDKTRMNILLLLAEGERNVTSLCEELNLPQPTVSHHLGLLRMNNLIANRRHGKQVFYGLNGCVDAATDSSVTISVADYQVKIADKAQG
jgi:DNA-binding transcriptional ArsR family regulator